MASPAHLAALAMMERRTDWHSPDVLYLSVQATCYFSLAQLSILTWEIANTIWLEWGLLRRAFAWKWVSVHATRELPSTTVNVH